MERHHDHGEALPLPPPPPTSYNQPSATTEPLINIHPRRVSLHSSTAVA